MRKKGQAAMEFLMTYGWAILAAVVVVGVLWFLIGNPADLAGTKFTMGAPFSAGAISFDTTAHTIQFDVRNGGADTMNVTSITLGTDCTEAATNPTEIPSGALVAFTMENCDLTSGSRFNEGIVISYTAGESTIVQQGTGTVTAKVP
jgi:uncharacterized protein (UPF0333 family)